MATEERIIKVKTVYDMAQPVNTLTKLEEEAKKAEKAAKALETQLKRTKDATKKDELAAQFVEAKLAADKATKAVEDHRKTLDLNKLTYSQLQTHVNKLNAELGKLTPGTEAWRKKLTEIGTASTHLNKAKAEIDKIKKGGEDLAKPTMWQSITKGIGGIGTAFQAIMALQVVGWILGIGKEIFSTTTKFEKYEATLTSTLGSQQAASSAMAALSQKAKELPQTLEQLTEGYIKLANRGLRPTSTDIDRLTDFSLKSGKSIGELSEAIMDINNQERWSEFGVKVSTSGNKITTTINGVKQSFDRTEEGAMQMAIALGSAQGTMGLAEKQMQTMGGALSNVEDDMMALTKAVGDKLKPVFIFLLDLLSKGVGALKAILDASDPVAAVFGALFDAVSDVIDVFSDIIKNIFPSTISGGNILSGVMKGLAAVLRLSLAPLQLFAGGLRVAYDGIAGLINGGKALVKFLSGDYKGAAAAYEASKKNFTNLNTHAQDTFKKIGQGLKDTFADKPAKEIEKGILPAKKAEKKKQDELTKEEKKGLEDRKKAQEEALKKIQEMQDEAHIERVRQTQGEVAAEKLALQQKADEQLLAIQKSKAKLEQKSAQEKLIVEKLKRDLEQLEEKHQKTNAEIVQRWTDSEHVQKIKKAQNFANDELKIARKTIEDKQVLAEVEKKIAEWLRTELAAIEEDKSEKAVGESDKAAKKQLAIATKRLQSEKFIMEQEHKAQIAVLDGLEIAHKNNAQKLLQIKKDRLDTELNQLVAKLALERKHEELKLKAEIKDEQELRIALENLNNVFNKREEEEEAKTNAKKVELEKNAAEQKNKIREGLSSAFGALLKGDLTTFASHLDSIVQGEKSAWQKRLNENMGSYQMIGQMAVQAANFLNDLTQKRVAKEIEEVKREFAEKKALLDASIAEEANTIAVAEQQKRDLKAQFSEEVKSIKNANEQMISDAEKFYNELSSADANAKFNEQVTLANQQADEKSRSAQRASSDAIDAARNERDESIIAAEATRDAEIAAIMAREDLDNQTKQRLIEAAKAKAELEINLATDEAETKMKLSKEEMEQKIKDAEEEKEAKIKLMEELMTADEERAKELLAAAEAEAEKKVELAEQEKNEKLKILEQEKAKRVSSKKELERQLAEEDKKAKNNEAQLKYKAAMTQWKTDQVSALVNGALATVKALASGFFPLNLVFAALTAVATGIQIAAIRSNRPAAPPSFALGGSAPRIGVGGLPDGGRHGSQYGESGIALVNRQTGREEGEMEGGEAIISRDQTEANLPLIQMMWKKARTRDKTPVMPMQDFKPLAFVHGGLAPTPSDRQMFLFGSKKRKAADAAAAAEAEAAAAAEADAGSVDTADAEAAHAEAKKQGEEQLKLLTEIRDGITVVSEEIMKVAKSTGETTSATRAVEKAVRDTNQGGKLDGMIGLISSLGKKTAA